MASFTTKLYFNTGFDQINVPDSAAILQSIPATTVDSVWLLQDYTGQIKINIHWDDVCNADYCQIGTNYYFITNITMSNINTAVLDIQLDAITTVGINNLNIINGWVARRHVVNDELFLNTLAEDFKPIEVLKLDMSNLEPPGGADVSLAIVASTVDLDETNKIADEYVNSASEVVISVPHVYATPTNTKCTMALGVSTNRVSKILPNTTLFLVNRDGTEVGEYRKALSNLWSLGLNDAITASYIIRWYGFTDQNYTLKPGSEGGLAEVTLPTYSVSPDASLNFKWNTEDYVVKNNKVFAGQFNHYRCSSVCGGSSESFLASQLAGGANVKPWFWVNGDISPTGTTYCRPFYFEGNEGTKGVDGLIKAVHGVRWQNQQLTFNTANAGYQDIADDAFDDAYDTADTVTSTVAAIENIFTQGVALKNLAKPSSIGNTATTSKNIQLAKQPTNNASNIIDATGVFSGLTQTATEMAKNVVENREEEFNRQTKRNLVVPSVRFPRVASLADYVGNGFYLTRERLSLNDTIRFDRYLTAYGYSTSEPLTMDAFNCRQYFNYIKMNDFNFTFKNNVRNYGLRMKRLIQDSFARGVRLWHVKPDATYFSNNPIKEV